MEKYKKKGHSLYIDNFYTNPQLLLDLLKEDTFCTGTVRPNRKNFPKEVIPPSKEVNVGDFRSATSHNGKLVAAWWRDRRDVCVLSTQHNESANVVLKRPKGSREKRPTPCPTMIVDYNNCMGGVDLADQYLRLLFLHKKTHPQVEKKDILEAGGH